MFAEMPLDNLNGRQIPRPSLPNLGFPAGRLQRTHRFERSNISSRSMVL
jgi:hypothetical protein